MEKYAKNVKTVEDVQKVPALQFIPVMDYDSFICPFCGRPLSYEIVGFGRDKCRQYHSCSCEVAQAAKAHNARQKELEKEAWLERQKIVAKKDVAQKSVTIRAEHMFCVVSGRILPGVDAVLADDAVGAAMKHAGFTDGSSKARLEAYAEAQGFVDGLKKASQEIISYLKQINADWDTDITDKVKGLCSEFGIPESLTL